MSKIKSGLSEFSFVKGNKRKIATTEFTILKIHSLMLRISVSQDQTSGRAEFALRKLKHLTSHFKVYVLLCLN